MVTGLTEQPSYHQGYARHAAESRAPYLWKGKVGHWVPSLGPTGDMLFDVSGNRNHGAVSNAVLSTFWVIGRHGYATDFDGDADTIVVPSWSLVTNGPYTLAAWMNTESANTGTVLAIENSDATLNVHRMITRSPGTIWKYQIRAIAGTNTINTVVVYTTGQWFHIVARLDGTDMEFFVDGASAGTATQTVTPAGINQVNIGNDVNSTNDFDGMIDDVRIYNRALPLHEIVELYENPLIDLKLRRRVAYFVPAPPAVVTPDMWHPEIQKPYIEKPEVVVY